MFKNLFKGSTGLKLQENSSKRMNLDLLFKGLKINNKEILSYSEYTSEIENLLNGNFPNTISKTYEINGKNIPSGLFTNELDYRYNKKTGQSKGNSKLNLIEKSKIVGKIGNKPTKLWKDNALLEGYLCNDDCKLEESKKFSSIQATNCVISGKWIYEAQMMTNGLGQIGWCQLNTKFTSTHGVGDDQGSYSYDGYRKVTFHDGKNTYGELWDSGDIIGCGIDLDKKQMEFFLNGKSLGIAFNNIPVGENIAYFPGISVSDGERCSFNFGSDSPFHYSYPGYESFDLPISILNGTYEITEGILNLFKFFLIPKIINNSSKEISKYIKILLTYKLFKYLGEISFKDKYILKNLIFPFLYSLITSTKDSSLFYIFMSYLFKVNNNQNTGKEIINLYFDILTNSIEEHSLLGEKGFIEWRKFITIFRASLTCDELIDEWLNEEHLTQLRSVFTSNTFRFPEFYSYLDNKYHIKNSNENAFIMIEEVSQHFYIPGNKRYQLEMKLNDEYSKELSKIIYILLTHLKKYSSGKILKDIFNNYIRKYSLNNPESLEEMLLGLRLNFKREKFEQNFYVNTYYNLLYLFCDQYIDYDFNKFSTEVFIKRESDKDIFYNELGLGGTLINTNEIFGDKILLKEIVHTNDFFSDYFFKVVRLSNELFVGNFLKKYESFKHRYKIAYLYSLEATEDNGNDEFEKIFKRFFYVFSINSQILFYKFGYFILTYLNYIKEKDPNLFYFLPTMMVEMPFIYYKLLYDLKSRVLYDDKLRKEINSCSKHFAKDDFCNQIINFYLFIFGDKNINHPEIREKLLDRINFFTKGKNFFKFFEKFPNAFDYLMNGLLNDMNVDSLSYFSSKVLYKLIRPVCFGEDLEKESEGKEGIIKIEAYFKNHLETMNEFLKHCSKLINLIMTDFSIKLSTFITHMENTIPSEDDKTFYYESLQKLFGIMTNLLKINEFFIFTLPDLFINPNSSNHFNFMTILKNLSLRILAVPYINQLRKIMREIPKENWKPINLEGLCFSIVGTFLKIESNSQNQFYSSFIKEVANSSEINCNAFLVCKDILMPVLKQNETKNKEKINAVNSFEKFINTLPSFKDNTPLTSSQLEELDKEGKICILCYEREANAKLIPCGHTGCNECIRQYRTEKNTCFICHNEIEDVQINGK